MLVQLECVEKYESALGRRSHNGEGMKVVWACPELAFVVQHVWTCLGPPVGRSQDRRGHSRDQTSRTRWTTGEDLFQLSSF